MEVHGKLLLKILYFVSHVDRTILDSFKTFYKASNDGLPEQLSEIIYTKRCTVEFRK